jgi:hypothetical protein
MYQMSIFVLQEIAHISQIFPTDIIKNFTKLLSKATFLVAGSEVSSKYVVN